MRLPDPSTPNLKIDLLAEISQSPRILSEVDVALKARQMKTDIDEYLKEMKKAVLKVELHDDKTKQRAMKTVSGLSGVDSVSVEMKDKKLTVIGDIDPVTVVSKLRKLCHTEIVSVGPAKEEKKKEEPKKEEPKKAEEKKKETKDEVIATYMRHQYPPFNPYGSTYFVRSAEEDPNACVIC